MATQEKETRPGSDDRRVCRIPLMQSRAGDEPRRRTRIRTWTLGCMCLVLAALTSVVGSTAAERPIRFDRLSLAEGLSQATVLSVFQDSRGYMWIGTEDGLNRYDGTSFKVFKHDPLDVASIPGNFVWAIDEDPAGNLWVGTEDGGVGRMNRRTGEFSGIDLGDERTVRALRVDSDGTVWVGMRNSGLRRLAAETAAVSEFRAGESGLPDDQVFAIHRDRSGRLWVGTDNGLAQFDAERGTFKSFADTDGLGGVRVRSIVDDSSGQLWVGTFKSGLTRLDPATGKVLRFRHDEQIPTSLSHDRVRSLYVDAEGRIWVGTSEGLALYDPQRRAFDRYSKDASDPGSLADPNVMSIGADRGGVMWVGTRFGGVHTWNPRTWQFGHRRSIDPSAPSNDPSRVTAFAEDNTGRLWLGAFGDGVAVIDSTDGLVARHRHDSDDPSTLSSDRVTALTTDRRGTVWVGTLDGGLNRYDAQSGRFSRFAHDDERDGTLSADAVSSIVEDPDGALWIGTFGGGLDRLDPRTMTFENYKHSAENSATLGSDRITSLTLTPDRRVWVGTHGGGIALLDPASGRAERHLHDSADPASLASDLVYAMFTDASGALWVGTTGGLSQLDPRHTESGHFRNYRERDGLPNNVVYGIQQDRLGRIWVSTNRGLACLDPGDGSIESFDTADGLQDLEFNFGAAFTRWNGQMLFGGINGYNAFTPERLQKNENAPAIVVTAVELDHRSIDAPADQISQIELEHRNRVIAFEFAALDFADSANNRFAYRLEGFDDDWVQAGTDNRLTYTNLDPGGYKLRVRAANGDGVWNETGLSLGITVEAPPWRSPWAYGGYTFSILSCLFGFVHVQRRKVAREAEYSRMLEAQVQHRTSQLTHRTQELEQVNKRLTKASLTDSLTGFANRRFLIEYLEKEISLVRRRYETSGKVRSDLHSIDLAFMMIDLDEFKSVNDTFGHNAGDEVLRQLRDILTEVCRSSDIVIRWGGDEFLVVARDLDASELGHLAERIRRRIAAHPFAVGDGQFVRTTCSIGFACYPFMRGEINALSWEQVVAVADRALYVAKRSGRNAWVGLESTETTQDETLLAELRYGVERLVADGHLSYQTSIDGTMQEIAWNLED